MRGDLWESGYRNGNDVLLIQQQTMPLRVSSPVSDLAGNKEPVTVAQVSL